MKIFNKLIIGIVLVMSVFALLSTNNYNNDLDIYDAATTDLEELVINGDTVTHRGTSNPVMTPKNYTEKNTEVRAVWLAYVTSDGPKFSTEAKYKQDITAVLNRMVALKLNTIFFQVRPMNDAMYESEYAPFSRFLYGTSVTNEGKDPGMDILKYVIDECHSRGIEFHAWLNPYRVSTGTGTKEAQLATLHDDNFAKQNPNLVIQGSDERLILNPGEPAVRDYLFNVVDELMQKYDIDGIHFDDYFYSYSGTTDTLDQSAFDNYNPNGLSRADWRRNNVNLLVEGVSNCIKNHNANNNTTIRFGISPFGIWKNGNGTITGGSNTAGNNSYAAQFADSKKWVEEGWLDYICPQTYWGFKLAAAPFADLVDWWALVCETYGVDLILGLGLYRVTETNDGWSKNPNELIDQINYASKHDAVAGFSIFSYNYLNSSNTTIKSQLNTLTANYWTKMPTKIWDVKTTKLSNPTINIKDNVITWDEIENADGYIVTLNGTKNAKQTGTSFTMPSPTNGVEYTISVEAVSNDVSLFENSSTEETFTYGKKLNTPSNISFSNGTISWDSVNNADGYTLYIGGETETKLDSFEATKNTTTYSSDNLYFSLSDSSMLWNRNDLLVNVNDDHGRRDQIVLVFDDPNKVTYDSSALSATVLVHVGADGTILERAYGSNFETLLNNLKNSGLKKGEVLMTSYGGASVFGGSSVSTWNPNENPLVVGDKISLDWSNGFDSTTNSYAFSNTTPGVYEISIMAYSNSSSYENSTVSSKYDLIISKALAAPVITLNNNIVSWSRVDNASGYVVTVNGVASDPQTRSSYTINAATAGNYVVTVKAVSNDAMYSDSVSSNSVTYTHTITSDTPSIEVTGTGSDGFYQEATITLSTTTSYDILYKINSGSWQTYSSSSKITLDADGEYTIYYKLDFAGATENSKFITIDNVAPEEPAIIVNGQKNDAGKYVKNVSFSFDEITDGTIYYKIDLSGNSYVATWTEFKAEVSLKANGRYVIYYRAVDQAGNASKQKTITIDVVIEIAEDNEYVIRNGKEVTYYETSTPIKLPTYSEREAEVRASWLSTVWNIDVPMVTTEEEYKAKIITMLDTLLSLNMNTIFFQVRSMNDAYYKSDYAPYSRFLAGAQGVDPGFDALGFVIEETHKRGMEFHAWMNPYRVSSDTAPKDTQLAALADGNFAKMNPSLVLADRSGQLILNPGEPRVQNYLKNVVSEILGLYDIDGIHFDDYFYSYGGTDNQQDQDAFNRYGNGLSREDWRRKNVDDLIKLISETINEYEEQKDKNVKFGISPFAIWRSKQEGVPEGSNTPVTNLQSYKDQFADSKKWVDEKWLDYICPQIYGGFDYKPMQYADMVDWWANVCKNAGVDLMIGQGMHRSVDSSVPDWKDQSELVEQIRYANQYDCVIGYSIFSYKNLLGTTTATKAALTRLVNSYWTKRATFPWGSDVTIDQYEITLNVDQTKGSVSSLSKDKFAYGDTVSLTATPKDKYKFVEWRINGISAGSEETISFKVTNDISVEAIFDLVSNNGNTPNDKTLIIVISIASGVVLVGGLVTVILVRKKKKVK
ncbi:family 10 glycosylhydrolase [Acholeplasma sp. OttesenSCG-928-E16]|nr:family 10 glycosylhydrolase [Acholeplasma sp. OttesenSCG-928-E16]